MSEINDQSSDTSSDLNWPLDGALEGHQHDRVVFENVADQYVKGEDVTAFFTILQEIKVDPHEDQIGLLRVGCTNINECIAYAPVQFNPSVTSGSVRHGVATFPSAALPVTDDEFYQFCYILQKSKNLGSSIPFQLNCALDDIDLLSNKPVRKAKPDGLIALADNDNDDLVVIHTKRMLTEEKIRQENRQLLDMNRRLEAQKDECQARLEDAEMKQKEYFEKLNNEMQALIISRKTAAEELTSRQYSETKLRTEYDNCRALCNQYQSEASQYAQRSKALEDAQGKILSDTNQTRNQLAVTSQLAKDQATQIIDLERRLMQSDEISKTSNQRQALLEQQIRDLRLTSEKHQLSVQGQLEEYAKQMMQNSDQINALETTNHLLKEEIKSLNEDNEGLTLMTQQHKDLAEELQQKLEQLCQKHEAENELAQKKIESLENELSKQDSDHEATATLKAAYTEIAKRCVKHQKTEIEVKKQLAGYQSFITDLEREVQELKERLSEGAEQYSALFRKYTVLEKSINTNQIQEKQKLITTVDAPLNDESLYPILQNNQENRQISMEELRNSFADVDGEVRQCPMCYWEFPDHLTVDGKREHIDHHFQ